ncbi:MAG: YadA-like family protein [Megasphaera elsdenii]|nr:YadA-like family protein [Megasphaera elsdenii]
MNRIYKVIWSKVKHQYIVVSELAHRDGKRSSIAGKSVKTMLAVCALCSAVMFGGYGMPNVYAAGADTLPGQYIAIGGATTAESTANDGYWEGRWPNREWVVDTYYRDLKDASGTTHKYVYTQGNDGNYYWVREGYSIEIVENKRYPTADKNTVINTYKGANADSDGLVQSYQNVQENMNIGTLNGDTLFTTNTDMYGGAVNTSTTAITTGQNYRIEQNGRYIEAGLNNLGSYFNTEDVVYHENTGLYTFHGQVVGTENLYVIGGNVGVFTTTANGDTLYTGDVYGRNNEILMTAVDEKGDLVSYWGAEIVDPNATIGSMTISTLEGKFDEVNKNIEKIHKDDIKEIQVAPTGTSTDGQGGTIGLQTNGTFDEKGNPTGGAMIPGGIKITSEYGNDGKDVRIKFANDAGSFTVDAGSKVKGTTGEASGDTLTGLSINGVNYKLGGGKSVTSGSINSDGTINLKQGEDGNTGITLSGKIHDYALDDQDKTATDGKVTLTGSDRYGDATYDITIDGLVTEDTLGKQIAGSNNLKVTAGEKGRWTITDTSKPEGEQVFANTTLADAVKKEGSKDSGYTYTVSDTAGNTAVIDDVASAQKLTEVNTSVTNLGTRVSTVEGDMITGGTIKDDGTITLSQQDKGTVSLTGKIHDYALDDQDKTATDGKVTLTGSDRYGNATYDITIDGLVTTDNVEETIAAKNNLKVTDGENGGWMITDSSQTDEDGQAKVFKNTTLDKKNSTSTLIRTSKENIYGQSFVISDTAGNMITINDIASAAKLQEVDSLAVKYGMKDGKVDYSTIQLMNPYTTTAEGHSGGTTITNVAYADIKGDGSAAVNVDLLKDTVADVTTTVTANEKHIATNQGDTADIKDGQFSVKDGKITLVEVDGNGNTTGNAVVIDNVAAASDLGDVTDIHEGLLNKDENGNTIDTSVVDAVNNLDDKVGDTQYKHDDGSDLKYVTAGDSVTEAIGDLDAAIGNATTIAGQHSSVSGSNNITVAPNGTNTAGGTDYEVTLNNHITLGDKAQGTYVDVNGEDGTVTASGNINAGSFATGNITINAASDDGTHTGTINGLSNTTWDANKVVSGQAATEDQLKAATEAAVQYDRNDKGEVDKGNISLGYTDDQGKQQYTQIHNVAAGSAPTDAVNVSQLSAVGNLAVNNYNNIQVLNGSINKLDNRIDRVGAGAAALAALHPLDFDPDAKWDFAAGYGNYRGANAVAVGAYYRPNEDVMFSVGGSMGGGENMVNAGVSLKIGAGSSNVTTSRVAMAKEIKSMRDIVAKQDAQIQKLTAMVNALVGIQSEPDTTTMFPDVPENHWAYEAVEAMAKSGLVKGYPDGEFKGDRTMTRYEFAQIVYNAIQAGAEVDARLVEEFKPELEYFHIATVAKDKDGNPTIERVRAN